MNADTKPVASIDVGLSDAELDLHPFCNTCGWRKGGLHSWNGRACKCGHHEPSFRRLFKRAALKLAGVQQ